jgi:O-antigen/teichoic acid export membrane protein
MFYVAQVAAATLNGLGRSRWTFAAHCASVAANLAVSLPLAAVYGLRGAVWGGSSPRPRTSPRARTS